MEVKQYGGEKIERMVQTEKNFVRMGCGQIAVIEEESAGSAGKSDGLAIGRSGPGGSCKCDAECQDEANCPV